MFFTCEVFSLILDDILNSVSLTLLFLCGLSLTTVNLRCHMGVSLSTLSADFVNSLAETKKKFFIIYAPAMGFIMFGGSFKLFS